MAWWQINPITMVSTIEANGRFGRRRRDEDPGAPEGDLEIDDEPGIAVEVPGDRSLAIWSFDRGAGPTDPSGRAGGKDNSSIPRLGQIGGDAGEVPIDPVDDRSIRIVVEGEHVPLLGIAVLLERGRHRSRVNRPVRTDRVPSLPNRGGAHLDLIEPRGELVAEKHGVGLVVEPRR